MVLSIVGLLLISVCATYFYKDELIQKFVQEANKSINTPISVKKIDVSALENFPLVSLAFHEVAIQESFKGSKDTLLVANRVFCTFNPIAVLLGDYQLKEVQLKNAKAWLKVKKDGTNNYAIFKKADNTQKRGAVSFALNSIQLANTAVSYEDAYNKVNLAYQFERMGAGLVSEADRYDVKLKGSLKNILTQIHGQAYLTEKNATLNAAFSYNRPNKTIRISPSALQLDGSDFRLYGDYAFQKESNIDLYLEGKQTNIQTVVSFLPEAYAKKLRAYKSKGEVYFDLALSGPITKKKSPAISVQFGFREASVYHPQTKAEIQSLSLVGHYKAQSIRDRSSASLSLDSIRGTLDGNTFEGEMQLEDFDDYQLKLAFDGNFDAAALVGFYPHEAIEEAQGKLNINISFDGKLADLKKKTTVQRAKTSGQIELEGLTLKLSATPLIFQNVNGNLIFNQNDLAISGVTGLFGRSDFELNGFFNNIITFLLFEGQLVGIQAGLKSRRLDLDELLANDLATTKPESKSGAYSLKINPNLLLSFDCEIGQLKFRNFHPRQIKGQLNVKRQVAVLRNASMEAMGGKVSFAAIVDANKANYTTLNTAVTVVGLEIDSVFHVFENFNQSFLTDQNLKGQISAKSKATMAFDNRLRLFPESLQADFDTSIKNGELNDFAPMQRLDKFLNDEHLDKLRFSELKNSIHIENQTIYLPQMEVRSNVSDINISGTHTFNQNIDYRVAVPINNRNKPDKDEAFGAIDDEPGGRSMIFLKIVGTTADYKVSYDTDRVKRKIVTDLKKEVKELKEAFKHKGINKKSELVLEEEYFDWDDQ